jgi:hypothetical protein
VVAQLVQGRGEGGQHRAVGADAPEGGGVVGVVSLPERVGEQHRPLSHRYEGAAPSNLQQHHRSSVPHLGMLISMNTVMPYWYKPRVREPAICVDLTFPANSPQTTTTSR